MEKKNKTPRFFVYVLSLMLLCSGMVFALPQASAAGTPVISVTDSDGVTYSNLQTGQHTIYQNYSTGVSPYITGISGGFDFGNLQVTKPDARGVDVYATWYGPYGDVLAHFHTTATITSWDIDTSTDHYWWISGHVDWSDTTDLTLTTLGLYRMELVGKVYDVGYPDATYHHIDYVGSITIYHISDQSFTPNYPISSSLFAVGNESSVWGLTGKNSLNDSEVVNWAYGGVSYSYLWTTIGYSIGYYGSLTWYGPNGATDYQSVTLTHNYTIARVEHQSNILIGGVTFSEAADFKFDNGYGAYTMVFDGKIYDSRYPDATGHFLTWHYTVTITYVDPTKAGSGGSGSNDPGGNPTGAEGSTIEPIVIQGFAATGGIMMPLGIMAGVWLWRKGNMMGGIACLVIMPIIGAGLVFAMLN